MTEPDLTPALRRLIDKDEIRDAICRYARGVDRGDWDLVRTGYHPDAYDAHGDYRGGIDGFIAWLDERFAGVDNSMHFLGQSLIEFKGPDLALVETYFVSRRLVPPTGDAAAAAGPSDAMVREGWGRCPARWRLAASATPPAAGATATETTACTRCRPRWHRGMAPDRATIPTLILTSQPTPR